ncbi:uncharacterized protein LOC114538294 [Dendronephthya gigantea]|uniref:uncharacterized protein LOC114538294 n=1 Tax=Dendronephthya gigantea TaxID=151771 RepID=UPI0010699A15|nr:uncharacterized protein LOC114538294 [Dendronephthya gigantea]
MNSQFKLTQSCDRVKPDLTVPSGSSDIRLVVESSENRPEKRRGFRKPATKMAKDLTTEVGARPVRRIKLNRRIFHKDSTAKPTINVKTLSEIRNEKKASEVKEKQTTEVSVNSVVHRPISPVAVVTNANHIPPRSLVINANTSSDTRTVVKSENITPLTRLLQPTFKLKLMTEEECKRNISNNGFARRVINRGQMQPSESAQDANVKKRKACPIRLKLAKVADFNRSTTSPSKKARISPIQSPVSEPVTSKFEGVPASSPTAQSSLPPQPPLPLDSPPSPLDSPPSPALSLGALSDNELGNETYIPCTNPRVVVLSKPTESYEKEYTKPVQTQDVHSRLGPRLGPMNTTVSQQNTFNDDCLDIMSVIADDDELFLEDKPNGELKRTLSQDSIFQDHQPSPRGNLRSLVKKPKSNSKHPKHSLDDATVKTPASKSFRIPRQDCEKDSRDNSDRISKRTAGRPARHQSTHSSSGRKAGDLSKDFSSKSHSSPKPTRVVSKDSHNLNGFSVQPKARTIQHNLWSNNIVEAWSLIKELKDSKSYIDLRLLEETIKVCEKVSVKGNTPQLAEIVLGVFEMLEKRGALKPMAYILSILTLFRCDMFQEGFDKLSSLLEAETFPPQASLMHFVNNLLKCLKDHPKRIIELISHLKRFKFSNPTHIFNNCLSTLVNAPVDALREMSPAKWDSLITMLCDPPNVQGAMQVQNTMEKHCIPISDESISKLLLIYQKTNCTKQLLDFAHIKCTKEKFDIGSVFDHDSLNLRDVEAHILDLLKTNSLPQEEVSVHFIDKASATKEYHLIYNVFLKSEASSVSFPVKILRKMVNALENWEDNMTASVEVYSTLRDQVRKAVMKDPKPLPPSGMSQKTNKIQARRCFSFVKSGHCKFGDRCRYSHISEASSQFQQNSIQPSNPQSIGKSDDREVKSQHISRTQPGTSTTMVNDNGHSSLKFPIFPQSSFVPIFPNHTPLLRVPNSIRNPPDHSLRLPCQTRFPSKNVHTTASQSAPRFASFRTLSYPMSNTPVNTKLQRSFSWEPGSNTKVTSSKSPLPCFQQSSPGSVDNNNNNNKSSSKIQQRVDECVASRNWKDLHLWYVESKQTNNGTVEANDLRLLRNALTHEITTIGSCFGAFVDQVREVKEKVSKSDCASPNPFDAYDLQFIGSLGVSLMEKCNVSKRFEEGYEVLHTLHTHNISYFDCGSNFGVYTRDIPPSAVAIIAVKLCIGMSNEGGLLGAVEVLRASNFAMAEENITPASMDHRIKVLQQLFKLLFDQGNITEAYEIVQHLNANPSVTNSLYGKVLEHYADLEDFDQAFSVVNEMHEKRLHLNNSLIQHVYKKFLKLCLANGQDDEAISSMEEMGIRKINFDGEVWQEILSQTVPTTNELLQNMIFHRCRDLGVYPATFFNDTPWLCELSCGYIRVEVKLLIVLHLKQLHQHLQQIAWKQAALSLSALKQFQITIIPRLATGNQRLNGGTQTTMKQNSLIVAKVLWEDLNPPLTISEQAHEQFHSRFVIDPMSLYRWFNANKHDCERDEDDDASSNSSIESCVSYMTKITTFD